MNSPTIRQHTEMDVYRADPAIAASDLKLLVQKSPAHFLARRELAKPSSSAMSFGTAMHYAILEPEVFQQNRVVAPSLNKNTKAYKDWKAEQPDSAIIVDSTFVETVNKIRSNMERTGLDDLLTGGIAEASVFKRVEGIDFKCRPDYFIPDKKRIIDLKTTRDMRWFPWDARKLKYPFSVAHYKRVCAEEGDDLEDWEYIFLAVESEAPFDVNWYTLKPETEQKAHEEWLAARDQLAECIRAQSWPGYCQDEPGEI